MLRTNTKKYQENFKNYFLEVIKSQDLPEDIKTDKEKVKIWKSIISKMTNEEIEKRSLLISLSPASEENTLFQNLLTTEYNNRK